MENKQLHRYRVLYTFDNDNFKWVNTIAKTPKEARKLVVDYFAFVSPKKIAIVIDVIPSRERWDLPYSREEYYNMINNRIKEGKKLAEKEGGKME